MILAITFGVGFMLGMYVVTQLEKGIDRNIDNEYDIEQYHITRNNEDYD
jgi:hypothetical protein